MEIITNIYLTCIEHKNPTINLLFVMVIVWTAGVVFRRFNLPPVLGEMLAGIAFGPPGLGIIKPDETLHVLSELGVFFLMFYAGLETNPTDLKCHCRSSLFTAIGGFTLPLLSGFIACRLIGMTQIQSLFMGMALSVTAIAVTARVLKDMNLIQFRVTPVIIGASIINDILSLGLFTLVTNMATAKNGLDIIAVVFLLLKVISFFVISIVIGLLLYPYLGKYFGTREAKGFTFALIMALVFGVLAEVAGLHIILGAYMAGLFVREEIISRDLFQKINDRFVSITYGFIGPIFFVSLSFHVTFSIFKTHLGLLLILFLIGAITKIIGCGTGALLGKMSLTESAVIGLTMNSRGVVELVIASIGLSIGVIDNNIFSILVAITFLTSILPPLSLSVLLKRIKLVQ
jgi:Kef-type K+ transport system membrane component KefB